MFTMTPYQSLTSVILLLLLVAAVMWAIREFSQDRAERASTDSRAAESQPTSPTNEPLATVIDLRTRRQIGHLKLVHDSTHAPSPALYDWQKQGI